MTLLTFVLFLVVTAVLSFIGQTISLQSVKEKYKEYFKNSVKYSIISLISLIVVYVLLY
jgi:Mn2+/Fe2+ NRAMP family transporter